MTYVNDMDDQSGISRFGRLAISEQERFRTAGRHMAGFARQHAIPIFFGPPPSIGGKINGGSGSLLQLSSGVFLITAYHVLHEYGVRQQAGEPVQWQVGNLLPFDPFARVVWKDAQKDIVLIFLLPDEVSRINPHCLISRPEKWPPPVPEKEQLVLAAGYPKTLREVNQLDGKISAGGYATMLQVTSVNAGYFMCQIEQQDLVSFNDDPVPKITTDIGGISGGPVFLVNPLHYPLIGVITESSEAFGCQLLRVSTLADVLEKDFKS